MQRPPTSSRQRRLHDALEHRTHILNELVRLIALDNSKLHLLLETSIRHFLARALRLRRRVHDSMLELIDTRARLVQPTQSE
jgi:hypothetical protein